MAREAAVARIAGLQEGRVSRAQLLERGIDSNAIDRRLASGRLRSESPGVYVLPGAPSGDRARLAVALLSAGPASVVSHLSAAAEHRMRSPSPQVVDITNARRKSSRAGIRMHHRVVHPAEVVRVEGLPLTSPAQTVFDLAVMLGNDSLAAVANQGFVAGVLTMQALRLVLERNRRRKGARAFRRLLDRLDPEGRRVRSPLEVAMGQFLRERGFPPWEQNVRLQIGEDIVEPDFLWRPQRVIVETDGRGPHQAPLTFTSDRRKDRRARVEGWQPVRVTWDDLDFGPDELDADLRVLLGL